MQIILKKNVELSVFFFISNTFSELDVGEAIAVGDAILLPSRIRLKMPQLKPMSATKNFWIEWENAKADNAAIIKAIENMRCQTKE